MFVIEKDAKTGQHYLRPAFIGWVKNNHCRRTLVVIFVVPTISAVLILNTMFWFMALTYLLSGSAITFLKMQYAVIRNSYGSLISIWNKPRVRKGSLDG